MYIYIYIYTYSYRDYIAVKQECSVNTEWRVIKPDIGINNNVFRNFKFHV